MSRYWQTLAIVCAIWAPRGSIDIGTFVLVGLVFVSLAQLILIDKRTRNAATPTATLN